MSGEPAVQPQETLVDLLRFRAQQQPERRAYTFLEDGESEGGSLTYAALDRRARAIAAMLQSQGAAGERVLLVFDSGLDFVAAFFGCLYAGVIAVPVYPPHHASLMPRLEGIAHRAGTRFALSETHVFGRMTPWLNQARDLADLPWILVDETPESAAQAWRNPNATAETLAFLQFTSGSTSTPRGVMLTHENLMQNSLMVATAWRHSADTTVVSWLPLYHDMGLVGTMLQSVRVGSHGIFMSPLAFVQRPARWLRAISRYGAHLSGGPNFAYDLCARKITPEECDGLDLSCWTVAFNGAEPVRQGTIERFSAAFARYGFRKEAFNPCYGLAETALFTCGSSPGTPIAYLTLDAGTLEQRRVVEASPECGRSQTLVGCGHTWMDARVVIADPETGQTSPSDQMGEIWIAGSHVAQGYWDAPEETTRTFGVRLTDTGEGPFLRTGDLGFVRNGHLFIAGRIKDLIIIDGVNHYPQDIELVVEESNDAFRPGCGVAFSVESDGGERVVAVQEIRPECLATLDVAAATLAARTAVSQAHDLHLDDLVLVPPHAVPKTSSGKVQRNASRALYLAGKFRIVK